MNPRRFLNFFRSPTGALTLFLIGLVIVLLLVNSRRPSQHRLSFVTRKTSTKARRNHAASAGDRRRDMVPFDPQSGEPKICSYAAAETTKHTRPAAGTQPCRRNARAAQPRRVKKFSEDFAPFGRLIPCELVITVDSSSIQTPIIGLVTEDIFHHGQLIIPAGTEVHGAAQVDRARERIASNGRWTLVWQNGQELNVSGLALDHERMRRPARGESLMEAPDCAANSEDRQPRRGKTLHRIACSPVPPAAFTEDRSRLSAHSLCRVCKMRRLRCASCPRSVRPANPANASNATASTSVCQPGKQFYLYITQTVDENDAKIGGTLTSASLQPIASPSPSPYRNRRQLSPTDLEHLHSRIDTDLSPSVRLCTMKQLLLIPVIFLQRAHPLTNTVWRCVPRRLADRSVPVDYGPKTTQ